MVLLCSVCLRGDATEIIGQVAHPAKLCHGLSPRPAEGQTLRTYGELHSLGLGHKYILYLTSSIYLCPNATITLLHFFRYKKSTTCYVLAGTRTKEPKKTLPYCLQNLFNFTPNNETQFNSAHNKLPFSAALQTAWQ